MAVNYAYANPVGYFTETQTCGGIKKEYKVSMLRANCLWAELYFYKNEEGNEMQQFVGFYDDLNHLKENIKDGYLKERDDYHFYESVMSENHWKAVGELVKAGKRVTIENHGNGLYELPEQEYSAKEFTTNSWKEIRNILRDGFNVAIR